MQALVFEILVLAGCTAGLIMTPNILFVFGIGSMTLLLLVTFECEESCKYTKSSENYKIEKNGIFMNVK